MFAKNALVGLLPKYLGDEQKARSAPSQLRHYLSCTGVPRNLLCDTACTTSEACGGDVVCVL